MRSSIQVNIFRNLFNTSHVILYVGQSATDEEIKEWLSQYPWSCVLTSRRDEEFAALFSSENRTILQYSSRNEIPSKPLSRRQMPILRLCGVHGDSDVEDLSWLKLEPSMADDINRDLVNLIPDLLDYVNPLVIIGADSELDWILFGNYITSLLYQYASDGTVYIWDMPASQEAAINPKAFSILNTVAEKKNFSLYKERLSEMLKSNKRDLDEAFSTDSANLIESDSDFYYQNQSIIPVSQHDLLLFKNVGTLLTDRTINRIRPLGRVMSRNWFSNFLENSALMGPQWYGYLPQSVFYVKRSYEDALVTIVRRMLLDSRGLTGSTVSNRPIILSGDPGSSKSITLAALAYRIFNEKINPVIFISKDSYLGSNIGTSFDELDEALQLLEQKAEKETKVLVIWDSSAFRAGVDQAQILLKQLENRGRRFVLVCSSYKIGIRENAEKKYYRLIHDDEKKNNRFEICNESNAQIIDAQGCYYVNAIREINEHETAEFWKRVKDYSGISDSTTSFLKQRLKDEGLQEIFGYYHIVISLLRENLEQALRSEQNKVYPYIEKELKKAIGDISTAREKDKQNNPFYLAFAAAGIEVPSDLEEYLTAEDEAFEKRLDTFNICVALFSRFRLSVPYGLAYTVLIGSDKGNLYTEEGQKLYRIVTHDIPWIYYGEDSNGDYAFRFRNPLEAEIFLRNHDANGEKQVDLLCQIIDIYGEEYRRNRCLDLAFTENLQALLRLVDPNSTYTPYTTARGEYEHRCILKKLDYIISKIESLKTEYGVPDEDAGFASIIVTFTREYYGKYWTDFFSSHVSDEPYWVQNPEKFSVESYELRIKKMINAIFLAESSIESLEGYNPQQSLTPSEKQHLINQKYSLVVEMAQCNTRLEDLIEEYKDCCHDVGHSFDEMLTKGKLEYKLLYSQLLQVINSIPTNGYAYNALFKAFIKMYNRGTLSEAKKLQYLSEIMQVVETCETLDSEILSRGGHGTDELTQYVNTIKDISTGYKISLSAIKEHRKGKAPENDQQAFCFKLYDEMLEANNAAAITFVCQKELRFPKGSRQLNTDQIMRCRNVYDFMMEKDNFECISTNEYALAMLIRVCWMLFNKTTLTTSPECQLTYCTPKQWEEINYLCSIYNSLALKGKQPLIILLYALSELQVSGLSETGYAAAIKILHILNENDFYQSRLRTPFMICDMSGQPVKYSGKVVSVKDKNGFIQVNKVPQRLGGDYGIRFRQYGLGSKKSMPRINEVLTDLELGIGFTCFSVFTEQGRKDREVRA